MRRGRPLSHIKQKSEINSRRIRGSPETRRHREMEAQRDGDTERRHRGKETQRDGDTERWRHKDLKGEWEQRHPIEKQERDRPTDREEGIRMLHADPQRQQRHKQMKTAAEEKRDGMLLTPLGRIDVAAASPHFADVFGYGLLHPLQQHEQRPL